QSTTNKSASKGFAQVGGLGERIAQLRTLIQQPLLHPERYLKYGLAVPKGVLLYVKECNSATSNYGPPGTGKTLLAKALAEELGCHAEIVEAGDLSSPYAGETEQRVTDIFRRCQEKANELKRRRPRGALLFVDEIDALCPKREEALSESERRVVATFLTLLDGVGSKESSSASQRGSVVLLAATNRPNALDPALRRPGRLDREIEIGAPNAQGRFEILRVLLDRMKERSSGDDEDNDNTRNYDPLAQQEQLNGGRLGGLGGQLLWSINDSDLREIAQDAHGFVGADLEGLCSAAALLAMNSPVNVGHGASSKSQTSAVSSPVSASSTSQARRTVSSPVLGAKEFFRKALRSVRPSALKELAVDVPNVRWQDIGGYADLKEKLQQSVEWPLKHGALFESLNLVPPRGILLYGPPGCSKTLMAKAVATESQMNFISVKGPELFNKYVGESERQVREIFRKARQTQPCVIFFDEIDSVAADRGEGAGGASSVGARVLSQLLNEMDGVGKAQDLVIMAATNRPEALDSAILRPGRFDRLLYVSLPDAEARKQILQGCFGKIFAKSESRDLVLEALLEGEEKGEDSRNEDAGSDTEDPGEGVVEGLSSSKRADETLEARFSAFLADLAVKMDRFSGAEVVNVFQEASLLAVREAVLNGGGARSSRPRLTKRHFLSAFAESKPRTSVEAIRFYESFEQKIKS
ncbi:unnamed protein product, partial [Amoebophrya sp. A25]